MIVGARHHVEAELGEVLRHGGLRHERDVPDPRIRRAGNPPRIHRHRLEVAERDVGLPHDARDRREAGVPRQQLRERAGDDQVADRGQRETVADRGLELLRRRTLRVEHARRRRRRGRATGEDGGGGRAENGQDELSHGDSSVKTPAIVSRETAAKRRGPARILLSPPG